MSYMNENPLGYPFNGTATLSPTKPFGYPQTPFDGDAAIAKIRDNIVRLVKDNQTKEEGEITAIDKTDLLYTRLYDALRAETTDNSLTDYFCFSPAFIKKSCNNRKYNEGHYSEFGVYVHLDTIATVIISTPKLQFRVSEYDLKITGVSVEDTITSDIIKEGLIPILKFIKSLAEPDFAKSNNPTKKPTKKSKK